MSSLNRMPRISEILFCHLEWFLDSRFLTVQLLKKLKDILL